MERPTKTVDDIELGKRNFKEVQKKDAAIAKYTSIFDGF
jgi:hypothetical protein